MSSDQYRRKRPQKRPERLIDTRTGEIKDFSQDLNHPPYAILSHTWLIGYEISFKDYSQPRDMYNTESPYKLGYCKIIKACQQAREDGHNYIWVDTCCIDQTNPAEVARNIKSMYGFYQQAVVCYAYLSDVRDEWPIMKDGKWEGKKEAIDQFKASRWFRRGWTLQELVAPLKVIFLNQRRRRIGDKHEMKELIGKMTGIPPSILQGEEDIHNINPMRRMSWCANRTTREGRDLAYCLLGILGLSMEPEPDESIDSAFQRLHGALSKKHPGLKEFASGKDILQFLRSENARDRLGISFPPASSPLLTHSDGHAKANQNSGSQPGTGRKGGSTGGKALPSARSPNAGKPGNQGRDKRSSHPFHRSSHPFHGSSHPFHGLP